MSHRCWFPHALADALAAAVGAAAVATGALAQCLARPLRSVAAVSKPRQLSSTDLAAPQVAPQLGAMAAASSDESSFDEFRCHVALKVNNNEGPNTDRPAKSPAKSASKGVSATGAQTSPEKKSTPMKGGAQPAVSPRMPRPAASPGSAVRARPAANLGTPSPAKGPGDWRERLGPTDGDNMSPLKRPAAFAKTPAVGKARRLGTKEEAAAAQAAAPQTPALAAAPGGSTQGAGAAAMQHMRAFFLSKLQEGLTVKEVNDLWLKEESAQHSQMFAVDFMRDGLQFWEKYGRKLEGVPSNRARERWQQMSPQAKTLWGAKAKIHNKIEYSCLLSVKGDLGDLSGKMISEVPVLSRHSQKRALQSVGGGAPFGRRRRAGKQRCS